MWRQRFEYLGAGQVLLCIFLELIMQSLTGINGLQGLVINLHTNPESACGIDVLCGQDAHLRMETAYAIAIAVIDKRLGKEGEQE